MMETLYRLFLEYPRISTDTRAILPDSIFFALKGEHFDGNKFVPRALESGAKYAVTDDPSFIADHRCMVVDDVLSALQQLSLHHRKQFRIPVIGITGTNGKTTTKELVSAILSKKYKAICTKGNLNNHIGVPLTLLSISPDDEIAIIEMGASHPGEIAELCSLSCPDHALITNIGIAHMEGFHSPEAVLETKKALYDTVKKIGGTIFLNGDDPVLKTAVGHYSKRFEYSQKTASPVHGKIMAMTPFLILNILGKEINTMLTGDYNLYNILSAVAVGVHFGVSLDDIAEALSTYSPDNCRSQIIRKGKATFIADYYNANPTSMKAALQSLSHLPGEGKMALLGDMLELGETSPEEHRKIMDYCKQYHIRAFFVGEEFYKAANDKSHVFLSIKELDDRLKEEILDDRIILVKGSRGIHMENLNILNR